MTRYFLAILIALTVGCGFAVRALALTVSPAKIEITGDAGKTVQGEIKVFNEQKEAKTFFSSFENFEPSGDSGTPHFIGSVNGLATWLKTKDQITLASGETMTIPFSIAIPANAEPGGYFSAIFWGNQPPKSQSGGDVSVGGKIGVLVLLRVSGEVAEGGGLLEFASKNKQRFFTTLPITFAYRFNNTGGDRVVPVGDIKIKNTFQLTAEKLKANTNEGSVLPSSTRKFEVVWGESLTTEQVAAQTFFESAKAQWNNFHFGWYSAKLNLTWGATKQSAVATYHFFIIPWQLFAIMLPILLILGWVGKIMLVKYNRFIINQATTGKNK